MRIRYVAIALLFTAVLPALISCGPKRSKGDQKDEKSEIISSLNRSDHAIALARIEKAMQANPGDLELHYFKAQAIASMTGIDVYNLMPVLKIKLFEVAMTEWQSYQRYKLLTESAAMNGLDSTNQGDVLAMIDIMSAKLRKMKPEEVTLIPKKVRNADYSNHCMSTVEIDTDIMKKLDPEGRVIRENDYYYSNYYSYPIGDKCTEAEKNNPEVLNNIRQYLLWNAQSQLSYRKRQLVDQKKTAAFVQGLYVLYDALPIFRQIPFYNHGNMPKTNEALEILQSLRLARDKNDRLGKNSRQQIMVIAFYIVASSIKASLDIASITKPQDIICHVKPERAADQYEVVVKAGKHLFKVLRDTDFYETHKIELNRENMIERAKEALYDLPEQSNDVLRKKIIDYIRSLQRLHC